MAVILSGTDLQNDDHSSGCQGHELMGEEGIALRGHLVASQRVSPGSVETSRHQHQVWAKLQGERGDTFKHCLCCAVLEVAA